MHDALSHDYSMMLYGDDIDQHEASSYKCMLQSWEMRRWRADFRLHTREISGDDLEE